jgi:hypothetical protein
MRRYRRDRTNTRYRVNNTASHCWNSMGKVICGTDILAAMSLQDLAARIRSNGLGAYSIPSFINKYTNCFQENPNSYPLTGPVFGVMVADFSCYITDIKIDMSVILTEALGDADPRLESGPNRNRAIYWTSRAPFASIKRTRLRKRSRYE